MLGTTANTDPAQTEKEKTISDLRRRLEQVMERRPSTEREAPHAAPVQPRADDVSVDSLDIDRLVPGEFRETPAGPAFVGVKRYSRMHVQGSVPLDAFFDVDRRALARFSGDLRLAGMDPARTLFFDTETTGLAGGTGVYAFLVGAGFFDGDEFVCEQFFMRDYGEETAALLAFAERARAFDTLVSFNGKTFDVGLVDTRFVMNRIERRLAGMPHLDLLHPSRRLWKRKFPDCTLGTLEERVLDLGRIEDIPGHEIPEVYHRYIRQRDARAIARVFRHNELDIVSLVALAVKVADLASRGPASDGAGEHELYSLGRFYAACNDHALAARCLSAARERASGYSADFPYLPLVEKELSLAHRRLAQWDEAEAIWLEMLGGPEALFARVELAKLYEHKKKDPARAIEYVRQSLRFRDYLEADLVDELEYRLARLIRKTKGNER